MSVKYLFLKEIRDDYELREDECQIPDFSNSETRRNKIATGTLGCQRPNITKMNNVEGSQKCFSSCPRAMSYNSTVYRNIDVDRTCGFRSYLCHLLGLPMGKSCEL